MNPYNSISGLTKREYFAAMALQGVMAHHQNFIIVRVYSDDYGYSQQEFDASEAAYLAVQAADALLKELSKVEQEITNAH